MPEMSAPTAVAIFQVRGSWVSAKKATLAAAVFGMTEPVWSHDHAIQGAATAKAMAKSTAIWGT